MLILAKTVLGIMLGFVISILTGLITIPILKKNKIGQQTCKLINERHIKKEGTPTLGGIIFIIPTILSMLCSAPVMMKWHAVSASWLTSP